jgi:glucose-6-phosphate 1-dehydrogenase
MARMTAEPDRRSPPCALVVLCASADLTSRKLLPALERLTAFGALPPEVALIGLARTPMSDDEVGDHCRASVPAEGNNRWRELAASARYVQGDHDDPGTCGRRAEVLGDCDRLHGTAANRLFHFSAPPRLLSPLALDLIPRCLRAGDPRRPHRRSHPLHRADDVGRSWRIVDPVLPFWAGAEQPTPLYQAATWGPPEATTLIARDGRSWRAAS